MFMQPSLGAGVRPRRSRAIRCPSSVTIGSLDSRGSLRGAGSGLWLQSFDAQQAPDGAEADLPQATTTGDQLRDGGEPFGVVADAMDHLADRLWTLRSEHGSVLQAMIDEILAEYQVSPDPDGTVSYPPFPLNLFKGSRRSPRPRRRCSTSSDCSG